MSDVTKQPSGKSVKAPQGAFGRDLTTESILRHLVAFSLPMLAVSLKDRYADRWTPLEGFVIR